MASLTFLGAARTVTGSKYLLERGSERLLVDAGLFQGLRALRERNWQPLPVESPTIDAVVLTHAHLDHSGYLPRLVAGGFRGRIFCTPGTADLCRVILPDAARLAEEDARHANRQGYTRHHPALPLFTEADAFRALSQLQPVGYHRRMPVASDVEIEFIPAGHLLGSAFVSLTTGGLHVLFGGDLGRYSRPIMPDPEAVRAAGVLLLESTYGNRVHDPDDGGARLAAIVNSTADRGGKLIVPAFAVGRVGEVVYWLKQLEDAKRIPSLPVFIDSPMAKEALRFYEAHADELDPDMRAARGDTSRFATRRFTLVASPQQSQELVRSKISSIVISSAGMATGGRVLHHLEAALPDARHTVLFVGYQAEGTRGRQLVDGAKEVKIHGRQIPVAARIERIDSMSAHADSHEILRWLDGLEQPPLVTYLVHGEPEPMTALQRAIQNRFGWRVEMPQYLEKVEL